MLASLVGTLSMAGKCLIFVVLYMVFSIWQLNHYGNLVDATWEKHYLEGKKQEALISVLGKPKRIQEEHPCMVHADGTCEYLDNYYILYYSPKNPLWQILSRINEEFSVRIYVDGKSKKILGIKRIGE